MKRLPLLLLCLLAPAPAGHAQEREIRIETALGLRFDPPRFSAAPGEKLRIELVNADAMMHNLLLTLPGQRQEIVNAALAMGAEGVAKEWVPDHPALLLASPMLAPGARTAMSFTVPREPGIYPYVCTFPGHGFIMYGAMYVGVEMPPLETDPNIPPALDTSAPAETVPLPAHFRTALPDCGPAAIAVGMPGGLHYAWDAGACQLRYAWRGGFVDNRPHWDHAGTKFSQPLGRIWYRAANLPLIRIDSPGTEAEIRFRGYDFVEGLPRFRYEIAGAKVREWIHPLPDGSGIGQTFEIDSGGRAVQIPLDADAGARVIASAGTVREGILHLTGAEAQSFTLYLHQRPDHEPLGYWSMNDPTFSNAMTPGVAGRAARLEPPKQGQPAASLDTGIHAEDLKDGATAMFWFRPKNPAAADQVILSIGSAPQAWTIGLNLDGHQGFCLQTPLGWAEGAYRPDPDGWAHAAVIVQPGAATVFLNGRFHSQHIDPALRLTGNDRLILGSRSGAHPFLGDLDEVRLYRRVLDPDEIRRLMARDRAIGADRR